MGLHEFGTRRYCSRWCVVWLSVSENAVAIQQLHQRVVGGRKIAELSFKLVLPFHAMKEVIAVAKDDYKDGNDAASFVVVASIDHGTHEGLGDREPPLKCRLSK